MSAQITQYYKYIYILYRDKEGDYRYLLDGSKVDKGLFDRKLTVNKQLWDTVYTSKKEYVSVQNNLDNLWMTYLKPIIIKNRVNAILSIDFSSNLSEGIENSIKPLYQTILYLFISFLIIIFILIIQAILSLKNKKESITDTLTQAKNRNYLKKISNTIKIKNYQIMLLDIDFFKKINDTYGHQAGDFILSELSKIIKNMIRDHDEFIRYGGEEFLLMIYNRNKNKTVAREIAERLRQRIQEHTFKYENIDIKITISIGISCFPENFKNLYEAIKYADRMLYLAKEKGRNIVIYKS
jgi:diguanylate cyclase (GGDEF)-like protein